MGSYSTKPAEPVGTIEVDGVGHSVWRTTDVPMARSEDVLRLQSREKSIAGLTAGDPIPLDFVRDYIFVQAPSLRDVNLDGLPIASFFQMFAEIKTMVSVPLGIATALANGREGRKARRAAMARSIATPSEQGSEGDTTGTPAPSTH